MKVPAGHPWRMKRLLMEEDCLTRPILQQCLLPFDMTNEEFGRGDDAIDGLDWRGRPSTPAVEGNWWRNRQDTL